ncbi:MAG: ABC transporter substrate-binding protein, partial [Bacteroidia bacterium]
EHFANDTAPDTNPLILQEALASLNFYEGALMAAGSLSSTTKKINFRIIDTGDDSLATVTKLNTTNMDGADAVVSYLPSNYTSVLTRISNRWAKPLYLFGASNTSVLEKNRWIRLVNPSNYTQITQAATYIASKHSNDKVFALYRDQKGENLISVLFADVIDSLLAVKGSCSRINYKGDVFASLKAKFSKTKMNVLIIPTSDESFLSSILNKLNDEKEDYQFTLMGMPAWENFNSIDPDLMKKLGAVFFNGTYIDTNSPALTQFRKQFISEYHANPTLAAYMGYDVVNCIHEEIENTKANREIRFRSLLNSGREIILSPVCESCGFESKSINLLKYGEYELVLVK